MQIEFKEKPYEKYFAAEIARLTNVSFSPDQCDEEFLGFDDAFRLPTWFFRRWLPHVHLRRWSRLNGISVRELDDIVGEFSRRMPPFRFNLFVQYKRPEYLSRKSAQEWSCWDAPYFRYETTPHQQDLLEELERQSRGRAATVYASPAFWKADDLWSSVTAQSVIGNSNIANVTKLRGHSRFTYITHGNFGKGHSDPVDLESPTIERVIEDGTKQEALPFNQHIKRAARELEQSLRNNEFGSKVLDRIRYVLLEGEVSGIRIPDESVVAALQKIEVASDAIGVSFFAIG
jgi:hypothetical protein